MQAGTAAASTLYLRGINKTHIMCLPPVPPAVPHLTPLPDCCRALRSVLPGEQLTISYLPADDSLGPPQYRQQLLQGRYGFRCDCERCR